MKINKWIVTLVLALVVCGSVKVKADSPEFYVTVVNNNGYHDCTGAAAHYYVTNYYTRYDVNNHYMVSTCKYCGDCREVYSSHRMETNTTEAIPKKAGEVVVSCKDCGYVSNRTPIPWVYDGEDCVSYDIVDFTDVYKDSKSITVKLAHGLKGAVLKVRIGNKTYKKKLNSNSTRKIKLAIKQHPIGSKIRLQLTYKGRVIGKDASETWTRVRYAKHVRNGMTKDQVRYTWGSPDDTSSASGGWSYWYYEDGSSVYFQNGRVRSWYDAEG